MVPGEIVAVMGKMVGDGCVNDLRARVRDAGLVWMTHAVAWCHAGADAYTRGVGHIGRHGGRVVAPLDGVHPALAAG